jgi:two-component system chemotaxis sensor kinase CheA
MKSLAPEPSDAGRFVSIGSRLAASIGLVLAIAAIAIATQLMSSTRERLVEGKRLAAEMVVNLFATSVTPALDFGDDDQTREEIGRLATNQDIVYAGVWGTSRSEPIAELSRSAVARGSMPTATGSVVGDDAIEITHVLDRQGGRLGSLRVRFSLSRENQQFLAARRKILGFAVLLTLLAAGAVFVVVRRIVVAPLTQLSNAARRLQQGKLETVGVRANDEVGELATAFNAMATAIVDRERSLADLNRRLQQLLDHMREAIVVFGNEGILAGVRSRQAETTFGRSSFEGLQVQSLLYPKRSGDVEAAAFEEWIRAAFSVAPSGWDDVAALAPTEVMLDAGSERERVLALDFRPVEEGGRIARIMMLANDRTDVRRLERTVKERDEEHERQMGAMRRLVAGGGQLLVSVLARAKDRLVASKERLLRESGPLERFLVEELFQHAHSVKGEARAFDLALLETAAAKVEDLLAILRGRLREGKGVTVEEVRGELLDRIDATLSAVSGASTMLVEASPIGEAILAQVTVQRGDVAELLALLGERADEVGRVVTRIASRPFGELLLALVDSVPRWAERDGKRARLEVEGREVLVPPALAHVLPDVMTHLVRNALAHGIERATERDDAGKPEVGLIHVCCRTTEEGPVLTVDDDGGGLDEQAILAQTMGLGLPNGLAADAVFAPGLSTAGPSDLAGRGVGLASVAADLASVGYTVTLGPSVEGGVHVTMAPGPSNLPKPFSKAAASPRSPS